MSKKMYLGLGACAAAIGTLVSGTAIGTGPVNVEPAAAQSLWEPDPWLFCYNNKPFDNDAYRYVYPGKDGGVHRPDGVSSNSYRAMCDYWAITEGDIDARWLDGVMIPYRSEINWETACDMTYEESASAYFDLANAEWLCQR